jgi:hypothetical protein
MNQHPLLHSRSLRYRKTYSTIHLRIYVPLVTFKVPIFFFFGVTLKPIPARFWVSHPLLATALCSSHSQLEPLQIQWARTYTKYCTTPLIRLECVPEVAWQIESDSPGMDADLGMGGLGRCSVLCSARFVCRWCRTRTWISFTTVCHSNIVPTFLCACCIDV